MELRTACRVRQRPHTVYSFEKETLGPKSRMREKERVRTSISVCNVKTIHFFFFIPSALFTLAICFITPLIFSILFASTCNSFYLLVLFLRLKVLFSSLFLSLLRGRIRDGSIKSPNERGSGIVL